MIFGLKEHALFRVLVIGLRHHGIRKAAAQGRSRGLDRKRRTLRDLSCEFHRLFTQAIRRRQHITKPPRDSFFARDAASGVEH
jgi:hypothetical protein